LLFLLVAKDDAACPLFQAKRAAFTPLSRCLCAVIASPSCRNRVAFTLQSRHHRGVKALVFGNDASDILP